MADGTWIPEDEWRTVVEHVPIVSVDLVVVSDDGVVLGKRSNEPAKGEWFVPGGRVHKNERLEAAARRIADTELGVSIAIEEYVGVYEHLYDVAETGAEDGKHYVAHAFVVEPRGEVSAGDDQHEAVRAFTDLPENLHEYTRRCLADAGVLNPG